MTPRKHLYNNLARLVWYPDANYLANARHCRTLIGALSSLNDGTGQYEDILHHLDAFITATDGMSRGGLEELFTRTFDINPVSSLELGWHLYGETYERGSFLVKMRDALRTLDIPESTELPDHLSYALIALGKMTDSEACEFASTFLLPALDKMLVGFAEKSNPYEHVLHAVRAIAAVQCIPNEGVNAHV